MSDSRSPRPHACAPNLSLFGARPHAWQAPGLILRGRSHLAPDGVDGGVEVDVLHVLGPAAVEDAHLDPHRVGEAPAHSKRSMCNINMQLTTVNMKYNIQYTSRVRKHLRPAYGQYAFICCIKGNDCILAVLGNTHAKDASPAAPKAPLRSLPRCAQRDRRRRRAARGPHRPSRPPKRQRGEQEEESAKGAGAPWLLLRLALRS